jgi:hypothetical protein
MQPLSALHAAPEGSERLHPVAWIDDTEELYKIARKHDAIIGRPLANIAAARQESEAETAPPDPGMLEIANPDDDVVDPDDGIDHRLSFRCETVKESKLTPSFWSSSRRTPGSISAPSPTFQAKARACEFRPARAAVTSTPAFAGVTINDRDCPDTFTSSGLKPGLILVFGEQFE